MRILEGVRVLETAGAHVRNDKMLEKLIHSLPKYTKEKARI